jgi:hypothetical protein
MTHAYVPDEELLRRRVASAATRGRAIGDRTAQTIAGWLSQANGPGFRIFLATGLVTPELYTELARLYDLRRPEVEQWLDALVRYSLRQPTIARPEDWHWLGRREGRR